MTFRISATVVLITMLCRWGYADETALKTELLRVETQLIDAIKDNDRDKLAEMLAEQHYSIDAHGRLATPELLPLLEQTTIDEYEVSEVRAFGASDDVGILTYKYVWSGTENGEAIKDSTSYATSVWARRDGRWKSVFYQVTPISGH